MKHAVTLVVGLFLSLGLGSFVQAATVSMTPGEEYKLTDGDTYSFSTGFTSPFSGGISFLIDGSDFVDAKAEATVIDPFDAETSFVRIVWSSQTAGTGTVFSDTGEEVLVGGIGETELATSFENPQQWLTLFISEEQERGAVSLTATGGALAETPAPIPLPAAGWMLLAGISGLAALRRRKKA